MSNSNLQAYTAFYEKLSPETLGQLGNVMTEDVHFVDPFNDVHGLVAVKQIFVHMFANLEDSVFRVSHAAMSAGPDPRGLILWELTSSLNGKPYNIVGMSEVRFAADGRVCRHIDHWDAGRQFYERLPIIGWMLKKIRARLSV
jgi:steroid delta-isomerase